MAMTIVCPDLVSTGSQAAEMSASDVIVVIPWVIFAAGVAVVSIRLHGSRRRHDAQEDAQETECPESNRDTRP